MHAEELGGEGELTHLSALAVGESQLLLCVHSGTGAAVWDLRCYPLLRSTANDVADFLALRPWGRIGRKFARPKGWQSVPKPKFSS